ncbi:hypothetical protein E3Q20_00377 [Wallemia mellicola]|nr:hypothetical protein E3Q20_00377 [Wallemia mellicola]
MKISHVAGILAVAGLATARMKVKRGGEHDSSVEKAIQEGKWIEGLWAEDAYKHHDDQKAENKWDSGKNDKSDAKNDGKDDDKNDDKKNDQDDGKNDEKNDSKNDGKKEDEDNDKKKPEEHNDDQKKPDGHKDKCGYTPEEKEKFIASGKYDPCLSLQAQAQAFRKKIASQQPQAWGAAMPSPSVAPTPGPSGVDDGIPIAGSAAAAAQAAAKRKKANEIYSQPRDTGVGMHINSQLAYLVQFIKDYNAPIRLEDLIVRSGIELIRTPGLLDLFNSHDRVQHDTKLDLYSYRHDFPMKSKAELLKHVKGYAPRGGMRVNLLKESWSGAPAAIDELERENEIVVLRGKDGQGMRTVFENNVKDAIEVQEEFRGLWHSLNVPPESEVARDLDDAGLKRTSKTEVAPAVPQTAQKKRKKAGSSNRRVKITNTHLQEQGIDLSKDFVPPGK